MWSMHQKPIIIMGLHETRVTLFLVRSCQKKKMFVDDYQIYQSPSSIMIDGMIFQVPFLIDRLKTFCATHHLVKPIIMTFTDQATWDALIECHGDTFTMPPESTTNQDTLTCNIDYLCPSLKEQHSFFYGYGFAQAFILQLHLIIHAIGGSLQFLASKRGCFIHLYKHYKAHTFRTAQLTLDIAQKNGALEELVSFDVIKALVQANNSITIDLAIQSDLGAALGAFLYEKERS